MSLAERKLRETRRLSAQQQTDGHLFLHREPLVLVLLLVSDHGE